MNKINETFSNLASLISGFVHLIILNLLIIFCSIPIFTAGAAITAGWEQILTKDYYTVADIGKRFFKSFKRNFKEATLCWLPLAFLMIVFVYDFIYASAFLEGIPYYFFAYLSPVLIFIDASIIFWVFPLISRYENKPKNHIINAAFLSMKNIFITLILWVEIIVILLLCMLSEFFVNYLSWSLALIGISGVMRFWSIYLPAEYKRDKTEVAED